MELPGEIWNQILCFCKAEQAKALSVVNHILAKLYVEYKKINTLSLTNRNGAYYNDVYLCKSIRFLLSNLMCNVRCTGLYFSHNIMAAVIYADMLAKDGRNVCVCFDHEDIEKIKRDFNITSQIAFGLANNADKIIAIDFCYTRSSALNITTQAKKQTDVNSYSIRHRSEINPLWFKIHKVDDEKDIKAVVSKYKKNTKNVS